MVIFLISLSGAGKGNLLMRALGQRAERVGKYAGVKEGAGKSSPYGINISRTSRIARPMDGR